MLTILNSGGTAVVQYEYDPWGNHLSITGSMATTLGEANPLRYRGYVFDEETELYYCKSRYYDSQIGRFINADILLSTGQGILGNNVFIYCLNNPVNYSDSTGAKANFWYKMFDDNDPGYIHRAVQVSILVKYNTAAIMYETEYFMPGIGRADIVCLETGEMWEIKHGGSSVESWNAGINNAELRVKKYSKKGSLLKKGRAGQFSGTFTIEFNASTYIVSYETPQAGVILYTLTRAEEHQANPDFVYAPHTLYNEIFHTVLAFAVVGGICAPADEFQYSYYRGD